MLLRTTTIALLTATPALSEPIGLGGATADWTGAFAGFTVGGIRSTGKASRGDYEGALLALDVSNGLFPAEIDDADIGAIGGFMLGYDRQHGPLVTGLELEVSFAGSDVLNEFSRVDPNPDPMFNGVDTNTSYRTDLDRLAMVRLRVGYATGATLLYATGGLAVGSVENRFTLDLPQLGYSSPDWSEDGNRFGYAIGAGVERRIGPRLSVRAELMHYDLRDVTVHASDPVTFPGQTIDYEFDNAGTIARLGVTYRF